MAGLLTGYMAREPGARCALFGVKHGAEQEEADGGEDDVVGEESADPEADV